MSVQSEKYAFWVTLRPCCSVRQGRAELCKLQYYARHSQATYIKTQSSVSSPPQCRSQAVFFVRYFLVITKFRLDTQKDNEGGQKNPFPAFAIELIYILFFRVTCTEIGISNGHNTVCNASCTQTLLFGSPSQGGEKSLTLNISTNWKGPDF